MIARCCTAQTCKTISPYYQCPLCDAPTSPLPTLELGAIGLQAKVSLHWTMDDLYHLRIDKASNRSCVAIEIRDLKHIAQPHLLHLDEPTGLLIMDSVKNAADLIALKQPFAWGGWVAYLIERLQNHVDDDRYQLVLKAILKDLASKVLEHDTPEKTTWTP